MWRSTGSWRVHQRHRSVSSLDALLTYRSVTKTCPHCMIWPDYSSNCRAVAQRSHLAFVHSLRDCEVVASQHVYVLVT